MSRDARRPSLCPDGFELGRDKRCYMACDNMDACTMREKREGEKYFEYGKRMDGAEVKSDGHHMCKQMCLPGYKDQGTICKKMDPELEGPNTYQKYSCNRRGTLKQPVCADDRVSGPDRLCRKVCPDGYVEEKNRCVTKCRDNMPGDLGEFCCHTQEFCNSSKRRMRNAAFKNFFKKIIGQNDADHVAFANMPRCASVLDGEGGGGFMGSGGENEEFLKKCVIKMKEMAESKKMNMAPEKKEAIKGKIHDMCMKHFAKQKEEMVISVPRPMPRPMPIKMQEMMMKKEEMAGMMKDKMGNMDEDMKEQMQEKMQDMKMKMAKPDEMQKMGAMKEKYDLMGMDEEM